MYFHTLTKTCIQHSSMSSSLAPHPISIQFCVYSESIEIYFPIYLIIQLEINPLIGVKQ